MYTRDAIKHFGGVSKLARALNVTRAAVYQWREVVPEGSAYKLQAVTLGALMVNPDLYRQSAKSANSAPALPTSDVG